MKKTKKLLIKTRNYVLFGVILFFVISFTNQLTYARVKYHSLGDDATKIYVKEIREFPFDNEHYDWIYRESKRMFYGKPKVKGYKHLYVDAYTNRIIFKSNNGGAIEFDKNRKYMMYYAGGGYVEIYDLATMKKERYNAEKIFDVLDKVSDKYGFEYMYDRYHIVGLEQTGKDEYWISLGDVRTGKVERVCRIKGYEEFDFIKFYDKHHIYFKITNTKKDYEERLYKIDLDGCKIREIKVGDGYIDWDHQSIYRNYKGEIRINMGWRIVDGEGVILKKAKRLRKEYWKLCGKGEFMGYWLISPGDNFILGVKGEVDPAGDYEYWIKGGKKCLKLIDFIGGATKLDLGLGDREVPDEIYWHPMGDRLIMKHKGKISIVILGRKR